jgi:quercetin dioxygenase-like cupin family protein
MKTKPFIVAPKDYDEALNVLGVQINVLASNAATRGYEITLQEGEEGSGPPPHHHNWDESFFVVRGRVEINCEGNSTLCEPGTLVYLPAGTVHGYRFCAGGGQMLEITGKGGCAVEMFTNVSKEVAPGQPDLTNLLEVLSDNGVTVAA